MQKQYLSLRILLGIISGSNIIVGIAGIIPAVLPVALRFYGATSLEVNPQIEHIIQMYGVYMLSVGVIGAFAVWNPAKNKAIIYGLIILLLLRVIQRLLFSSEAFEVFGISSFYYWAQTVIYLVFAAGLFLLRPKADEPAKSE